MASPKNNETCAVSGDNASYQSEMSLGWESTEVMWNKDSGMWKRVRARSVGTKQLLESRHLRTNGVTSSLIRLSLTSTMSSRMMLMKSMVTVVWEPMVKKARLAGVVRT